MLRADSQNVPYLRDIPTLPATHALACPRTAEAMCYWPWGDSCSLEGYTRQRVDCGDGDGIDDWTCVQHNTSYRGVLLSSSACNESHWTNADKSLCMPVFKGECRGHGWKGALGTGRGSIALQ